MALPFQNILAVVCLFVVWVAIRLLLNRFANLSMGCPRCHQPVSRLRRRVWEKWLGAVWPGLRRYYCKDCGWEGLLTKVHIPWAG